MNNTHRPRYTRCLNNQPYVGYASQTLPTEPLAGLIVGAVYKVVPPMENDGDLWRVIDETGEDYLYPARYFEPLDLTDSTLEPITVRLPAWLKGILHAEAVASGRSVSGLMRDWLIERQTQSEVGGNESISGSQGRHIISDTEYLLSMAGIFHSEPSDTSEKVSQIVAEALLEKYERSEL